MSRGLPPTRRQRVVDTIRSQIHSGALRRGDRLAGENSLAAEFDVSRGTIRQALVELQHENLIATHTGVGSFVSFDGVPLDAEVGWARTLAMASERAIETDVLSIEPIAPEDVPGLPADSGLVQGIAVRRTRRIASGPVVSFECATVPAIGTLADLPTRGLPTGSLSDALRDARLIVSRGTQDVSVVPIPEREAAILKRKPGSVFLHTVRTAYDRQDRLVEHVVSYLDPEHFSLRVTFGDEA